MFGLRLTKRKWEARGTGRVSGERAELSRWPRCTRQRTRALAFPLCCFAPARSAMVISSSLVVSNVMRTDNPQFTLQNRLLSSALQTSMSSCHCTAPWGTWGEPAVLPLSSPSPIKATLAFQLDQNLAIILDSWLSLRSHIRSSSNAISSLRNENTLTDSAKPPSSFVRIRAASSMSFLFQTLGPRSMLNTALTALQLTC